MRASAHPSPRPQDRSPAVPWRQFLGRQGRGLRRNHGRRVPWAPGASAPTIRPTDLPTLQAGYLGPTADQALNPFPNTVEQNIREKKVCQAVKTATYKKLFDEAYGEDIDCSPNPKCRSGLPHQLQARGGGARRLADVRRGELVHLAAGRRNSRSGQHFPLADFTDEENLGHDLFYGKARCVALPQRCSSRRTPDPKKGEAWRELYTDNAFHNIGVPFNREIPGVLIRQKVGLSSHVPAFATLIGGFFKTPTLRNVAKGLDGGFVKAYATMAGFKSLKSIVHFYNTRDSLRNRKSPASGKCEELGFSNATEAEARKYDCWPPSEFPNQAGFVIGNLGLTGPEEDAIVAYMETLTDAHTPTPP